MSPAVMGLMTIASLGVHLEEVVDVSLRDATEVAQSFARSVEGRTGLAPRVDDPLSPRCAPPGRCLGNVAARTNAEDLVFVRLIGGVTKIRVIARRYRRDGTQVAQASVTLPRDPSVYETQLDRLSALLFSERFRPTRTDPRVMVLTPPREERSVWLQAAPWVVLGVGVTAGAVGVAFGRSSASAQDRIRSEELTGAAYTDALNQMRDHGTAANVLLGVAVGTTITGVAWLLAR